MKSPTGIWPNYDPAEIEPRWQQLWEAEGLYLAHEVHDKPKYYCLDFFPYPSGDGLHVGHCRNYVPTDVLSRYKRMRGFNILHPMGWDAFGEPAEQHAVRQGVHPRQTIDHNTANFKRQMRMIGASYDWSREIDSSDPHYYRWTQWFFLLLYKRGLAYRDTHWQWWCPTCQTTLSSHEAVGGVCWRGHSGVTRREIPAWYFRITQYADELIDALDGVDWPEKVKNMQRNWIGRSQGAEVHFKLIDPPPGYDASINVFTTRPDTLFGVTFFALAPEHPLAQSMAGQNPEIEAYIEQSISRGEVARMTATQDKSGVFTGYYVTNPLSGDPVPVWVADYVVPGYGGQAIMGVPAHDRRDYEFACKYGLPIKQVILHARNLHAGGADNLPYEEHGWLVDSGGYSGLESATAAKRMTSDLQASAKGRLSVQYRMHDWLISRQRYWGAPIPIIHCPACGMVPVPEDQLPVMLPPMDDFTPDGSGRSPLARLTEFVNAACPRCGENAHRETDTMGGFACSSWYYLRFTSPNYEAAPFEADALRYWMPVDLYVGGAEHAVLHLLYARFWTKVMADAGMLMFREPFTKLINQGQMLGASGQRMSKSRGNVVTPDEFVASHGADALRLYELFMAPFEQDVDWNSSGINGTRRFLNRLWALYADTYDLSATARAEDLELRQLLHQTIKKISERIETFRLNTMVSAIMEFTNVLVEINRKGSWKTADYHRALETLLLLIAPAAPFIAEELWLLSGHTGSVHLQEWPIYDPQLARDEMKQIAVQIDGKLRSVIEVPSDVADIELRDLILNAPNVRQFIVGRELVKTFYVPGKVFSMITRKENTDSD